VEEEGKEGKEREEGESEEVTVAPKEREGKNVATRKNRRHTPRRIKSVVVKPTDIQSTPGGHRLRAMTERRERLLSDGQVKLTAPS
jgi:hypothetical protein